MQLDFFASSARPGSTGRAPPPLIKWIGNKSRFAPSIVSTFPRQFGVYFEPFLGSGAILGTLSPARSVASDSFPYLIGIWQTLQNDPDRLISWYEARWTRMMDGDKVSTYDAIRASYNAEPNAADFLFLCRACYGGVVRFRKHDGYMSTPCGSHRPISPETFGDRVREWHHRTINTRFATMDYRDALEDARTGDLVYCDPPYSHSQSILYGAQSFELADLISAIDRCKARGVYVALSIDGTKKSGNVVCDIEMPNGLFEQEILVDGGRSMLRRFQMGGASLEEHRVADRLLLTYPA